MRVFVCMFLLLTREDDHRYHHQLLLQFTHHSAMININSAINVNQVHRFFFLIMVHHHHIIYLSQKKIDVYDVPFCGIDHFLGVQISQFSQVIVFTYGKKIIFLVFFFYNSPYQINIKDPPLTFYYLLL